MERPQAALRGIELLRPGVHENDMRRLDVFLHEILPDRVREKHSIGERDIDPVSREIRRLDILDVHPDDLIGEMRETRESGFVPLDRDTGVKKRLRRSGVPVSEGDRHGRLPVVGPRFGHGAAGQLMEEYPIA